MSNFEHRIENFKKSVERLEEALAEYNTTKSTTVRDGAIHRFKLCTELAWKTTREYLAEQGFMELNSPKTVMREASSYKIIDDQDTWIQILNDRNLTFHVYDDKIADEIVKRVGTSHILALKQLLEYLTDK
ncbi:HI0074 family nucleotidyltransferase substrate-binding subunit [Anaerotignum sp. MB30-C6]|uniref:HI0074 family nucleotidyltransferase substrate-binding subunit n=1 Tax=Anaerotignum sp. MB30-C6 TaxID=3070814 RepID=UPI0027DD0EB7|nr:HI0074 family nucleotidyltransferase substrate-binding subunit [Anaerotignum sp. MB30-C6]WMI82064.1 HI0074 family nucleotidyltransferase substrate-binding subunit [Anaerotignum sp. MB30-C6]